MATFNKFNAFVENVTEKVHDLGADALRLALSNTAPVAGNSVLADLTEIAYTNLTGNGTGIGGRNPAITSSAQTSGTYKLVLGDLILTASGAVATFRYVALYNDTPTSPADPLIGWWDYGSGVTLANGETFTVDFDQVNGVLQLA